MKHWLPYSELANTKRVTREEFRKALSKLPRSGVLIACARLSSIFDYGPDANTVASDEATISWIPKLLPPPLVDRALSFLRQGFVIFFQGQLRYLAAEVMRLQKNDIESDTYFPDLLIGPLLLCAGELLYTPQPMQTKDLDKMAGLVAMFLPIYEIDSLMDPFMLFVRFYIFLTICIPRLPENLQTFDPYVEFDKVFHLPLKSYYIMVFTMMMNGLMYRGSGRLEGAPLGGSFGRDWYKETNLTDKQLDQMFNSVSFTLADLPDNKEPIGFADFETLRDKPYFRHKDQMYCLDYEYAVGKLESGVIWRVRSSLPDKKRLAYFSFWGEVFEEYIAWLFEEYAHKQLNQFYRSPKGPDGLPLCDAVVVHGSTAILIETKLGTCAANVRYACDYKKMREFLEDKLVSGTNRDVGVQQLLRAVKTISATKWIHYQRACGV